MLEPPDELPSGYDWFQRDKDAMKKLEKACGGKKNLVKLMLSKQYDKEKARKILGPYLFEKKNLADKDARKILENAFGINCKQFDKEDDQYDDESMLEPPDELPSGYDWFQRDKTNDAMKKLEKAFGGNLANLILSKQYDKEKARKIMLPYIFGKKKLADKDARKILENVFGKNLVNSKQFDKEDDQYDDESKLQKQEQLIRKYGSNWLKEARKRLENKDRFSLDGPDNFKLESLKAKNNRFPFESYLQYQKRIKMEKRKANDANQHFHLDEDDDSSGDEDSDSSGDEDYDSSGDEDSDSSGDEDKDKEHINLDDYYDSSGDEYEEHEDDEYDDTNNKYNRENDTKDNRVNKLSWEECKSDRDCPSYVPKCDLKNNICIEQKEIPPRVNNSIKKGNIGIPPRLKNRMSSLIDKAVKKREKKR
jgi:hypothetical protein